MIIKNDATIKKYEKLTKNHKTTLKPVLRVHKDRHDSKSRKTVFHTN